MKRYYTHRADGVITTSGTYQDDVDGMAERLTPPGETFVEGEASPLTHYVREGALCTFTDAERTARASWPGHGHQWSGALRDWVDGRTPAERLAQRRAAVIAKCKGLLADSDWVAIRASERGEAVPEAWRTYRQALRDIQDASDPASVVWPTRP